MTDTMRDWYNKRFANRNPELCEHGYEDMLEAWQAAQADARALVGEMVEKGRRIATPDYDDKWVAFDAALTKAQAFVEGE